MGTKTQATHDTAAADRSVLDRRRDKLQATRAAAAAAAAAVRQLDERLDAHAEQGRQREAALHAALDGVAALKKAIKSSAKEAVQLCDARTEAGKRSAKAQQVATAVEARYDSAVLADMVRRQKEIDLSAHGAGPTPTDDSSTPSVSAAPAEAESTTPRLTAARRTAARAHVTTDATVGNPTTQR